MELRCLLFSVALLMCFTTQGQNYQDCTDPYPICKLASYHFETMSGHGDFQDDLPELRCMSNNRFKETNSKWLFLEVGKTGTLVFNIEAIQEGDDIDFVLFEIDEDCADLKEVRCMASGKDYINKRNTRSDCIGNTGLSYSSLDDFEKSGCKYSDDNYLKFLAVHQDEKYVLLINNYDSEAGFSISFNGDCQLRNSGGCISDEPRLDIVNLYPNPTSNALAANFNSISDFFTVQILDTAGKVIKEDMSTCLKGRNELDLDVSILPSGTYILSIKQAGYSASKTFVKEN